MIRDGGGKVNTGLRPGRKQALLVFLLQRER